MVINMGETNGVFSSRQGHPVQEAAPPLVKKADPVKKFFAGIVVSFLIMGAFIGIQVVVAAVAMTAAALSYILPDMVIMESGADPEYVMEGLQNTVMKPDFMTNLTAAATVISAVFAVFFYWLFWGRKRTAQDKAHFREKVLRADVFLMIAVAVFGLYFLSMLIASVIGFISPSTMESYEELMNMALGGNAWIALLAAVVLAPVSEECIMRGLVLKNLQKYFSVPAVIVIQAAMFGIFHMNWVQGIYVLPIGAAQGFVAIKSRSVLPCIYMHMLYNFMSVVVAVLPAFCQEWQFCLLTAAVCAGLVWLMAKKMRGHNA